MEENNEYLKENTNTLQLTADILFAYLRAVIYDPANAVLDLEKLPQEFVDFGKGMQFFAKLVFDTTALAKELANGNLNCELPHASNEIAAPLKMLHSSLRHLAWQTQRVAKGDYKQHVDFMGDFALAFNDMTKQLEHRWQISLDEKSRLELYVDLMLANYPAPVLLFDRLGRLVYVSDSYLLFAGLTSVDSILGKPSRELLAPLVPPGFIGVMEKMFESVVVEKSTATLNQDIDLVRDGQLYHYHIQVAPMLDAQGDDMGVIAILNDNTKIVRAHREAEHSSRAKSDFLARMSHEMRTPMNAILGMTTICGASNDRQQQDHCLAKIEEAAQHLLGVINDVLDMSNMDADKFTLFYSACDLPKLLDRALKAIAFSVAERKQQLNVRVDAHIPAMVLTDEQRLQQVLGNLLSNAVKFSAEGGEINFIVEQTDANEHDCRIRFAVEDQGVGMDEEQQKLLFVPFEQAEGGFSRKYGGTGLGLAISQHIVRMLGGEIEVVSASGQGATFTFEIPFDIALPVPDQAEDGVAAQEQDQRIFNGLRLLLADDVEINREIVAALLEDTGIEIEHVEDGLEAFKKFTMLPEAYDLILMDIHMPNMDGYEATRRIRACGLPRADTIPIIAMTANVYREDVEKSLECGMNSHLGKPVDMGELIARLKEYLLH